MTKDFGKRLHDSKGACIVDLYRWVCFAHGLCYNAAVIVIVLHWCIRCGVYPSLPLPISWCYNLPGRKDRAANQLSWNALDLILQLVKQQSTLLPDAFISCNSKTRRAIGRKYRTLFKECSAAVMPFSVVTKCGLPDIVCILVGLQARALYPSLSKQLATSWPFTTRDNHQWGPHPQGWPSLVTSWVGL